MKAEFKNLLSKKEIIVIFIFFISLIIIGYFTFFTANHYDQKSPIKFEIEDGESFSSVVDRLYEQSIIPSRFNFKVAAFLYGAEKNIKAARFYIPNDLSYLDLLDLLTKGPADYLKYIKINDGQTIKWLGAKVRRDLKIDSASFVDLANDRNFISTLGLNESSLEGYLFSKSYKIYERSTPEEALIKFYNAFKEFFNDSLKQRAKEIGMTVHQVLTLASIIKGETDNPDEMPIISGVYHNRLKIGMRLQADPTIQYLLPGGWRRLTYKDLEINSPYNTYRYSGLPPGPINNPGKNAILAALYPDKNNYLYFVSDGNGKHRFSRTYSEHLSNVTLYRRWLNQQNKK